MGLLLTHHLNALHIMVRLTRLGVSRPHALIVARWWESFVHSWLYGRRPIIETARSGAQGRHTALCTFPVRVEDIPDANHCEVHRPAAIG
jgi:hypothetical protein